jgi:predicted nucleotidyltransferase
MLNSQISEKLPMLKEILEKYGVAKAYIFGSATGDNFTTQSDIDLLISLKSYDDPIEAGEQFWGIYYDTKELFKREVDILSERNLKNPFFIEELNNSRIQIYG